MNDACRRCREQLGVVALGRVTPAEQLAVQAHLDGCSDCRAEARSLTVVAATLDRADADRVAAPSSPAPPALMEAILRRLEVTESARRRRRWTLAGAVAAALAVVLAAVVVLRLPTDPAERLPIASDGISGVAEVDDRPWGTEIELAIRGLTWEGEYRVWVEDRAGQRVPAGTFWGRPEAEVRLTLAAALPLDEVAAIGISTAEGEDLLRAER